MQTETLFNINAKAPKTNDSLIGKASTIDLFTDKKANSFNSAYKSQLNKHAEQKSRQLNDKDKNLPQSGNELPDKKLNSKEHEAHAEENVSRKENNDSEKESAQDSQTSKRPESQNHKQQSGQQPENNQPVNKTEESSAEAEVSIYNEENTDSKLNETTQNIIYQQQNQANVEQENLINKFVPEIERVLSNPQTQTSDQLNSEASEKIASETMIPEILVKEVTEPERIIPGVMVSDAVTNDKKSYSETTPGQQSLSRPFSSDQIDSKLASKAGSDNKDGSALGKSIADFQNFIEMSKKHSSAGEPIASVKGFQDNLKAELLNTQMVRNEIKLPTGQNLSPAQLAMQVVSNERMTAGNLSSTNPMQNLPSLEVKTTVGRPGWNQGFSQQIVMMASNGIHQAKIKLNPVHLGPVEAMVKLKGETAVVNLTSLHLTTKEAMDTAIPRLKEMLNENGFSQVDVNVSHQDKKSQQEANLSSNQERSDSEHGNSTMPGEEQLSEVNHDSDSDVQASESSQDLNIVDYYA